MKNRYLSLLFIALSTFTLVAQVPAYVPTNGLVGWWPFNGNANDLSGNGNNGTVTGATLTTDRFGSANQAYSFDGSTSHIYVPFSTSMNSIQTGITMSAWILMDGGTPSGYPPRIMELRGAYGGGGDAGFVMLSNGNSNIERSFEGRIYNNSGNTNISIYPTTTVSSLSWHYVVFTADGNNASGKFYVDGNLVNTNSNQLDQGLITACNFNYNPLYIGAEPNLLGKWGGKLDDIGIWNRALTQAEVSALYTSTPPPTPPTVAITPASTSICAGTSTTLSATANAGSTVCSSSQLPTGLQSGLVGYWPFCGNADDESGNGNNGTVNGATLTTDRFGNASSAYSFDGVDDRIQVILNNPILTNSTISVWYKTNSLNGGPFVHIGHDNGGNPYCDGYHIGKGGSTLNNQGSDLISGFSCIGFYDSNVSGIANQWNHATMIKMNNQISIYLNGTLVYTQITSNAVSPSAFIFFGSTSSGYSTLYSGDLDDISIWNRTLTATEIEQLYTLGNAAYSWSPGGETTPSITVSPTATTTYTCTATANGVSASASSVVTVLPSPTITTTNTIVCAGQSTTLTAAVSGSTGSTACPTLSGTLSSGLVGFWPFCGNANDASGNGNNGTVNGATLTTDRFGNASSAYSYDGVSNYISLLNPFFNGSTNVSQMSYAVWIKVNSLPSSNAAYSISNKEGFWRTIGLNINNDGSVSFGGSQPSPQGYFGISSPPSSIPIDSWKLINLTFDNNTLRLFIDGSQVATTNISYSSLNYSFMQAGNSTATNLIGAANPVSPGITNLFNGIIDDFTIWNRALTTSEIQQLYTTGQATYSWSPGGATTPSITVSPTTTTTYTCTVTDASGNSCSQDQLITVNPTPTVNAGVDQNICSGSTATLTATGAATYSWNNSVQNGVAFTPSTTTTYTVTGTDANGCTGTDAVTVTLVPSPTITATNTTVCAGQSTTLSVNGGQPSSSNCIGNLGSPNPWPYPTAANAGYIPLGTFGTQSTFSVSMWINPSQTQNGVSIILDASHGGGANWVIQSINYGATWTWGTGEFTLTPNAWQHLLITYDNGTRKVFVNGSQVLSWTQLMSYSGTPALTLGNWTEGGRRFTGLIDELYITTDIIQTANFTPPSIIQTPSPATFGLWHFDEGTGTSTSDISNVGYPLNNWYWATRSLSSGSSSTVSWSPGGATTPSITVSPTTTTTYTCTVTDASGNSCSQDQLITVNPTPDVNAGADLAVCNGSTATLTATGATSYIWNNSVQNGVSFTPSATTTYTVTGTDANGCTGTDAVTVTLVPSPTITATNTTVCAGQSTTLSAAASGSTGSTACPTISGTLSSGLVGFWPFCGNANDESGNGNNGTVNGATLTTDRFGNTSSAYSFDGVNDRVEVSHNQLLNCAVVSISVWFKTNTFLATNGFGPHLLSKRESSGWGSSYQLNVGIDQAQNACWADWSISGNGGIYYSNNILNSSQWFNLVYTHDGNSVKLYLNGILVETISSPGLLSYNNLPLWFGARPDAGSNSSWFNGKLDDIGIWNRALTATEIQQLYTTGQTTYSWSPGGATTPSITVSPTTTTTYTCTVTDANGNSCSQDQTITVIPFTGVDAGIDQTICAGGAATLSATGASTYSWNNAVQNGVAFTPLATSSYIVTGTQNGCTDADTVLVTVVADPTITNPVAASYCQNGGTVTPLSVSVASGIASAYAYQWYANTTVNNFGGTPVLGATTSIYTPPINTVGTVFYYCTVTQGATGSGCLATSGANSIVVNAQPTITSQPVVSQNGCVGAVLTPLSLTIAGGNGSPTYQWYSNTTASTSGGVFIPGAISSSFTPSNTTAGTYYFYCVASYPNATSCATKTSNLATITLINDPIITTPPTANQSICVGGSIPALTFNSSGGSGTASYQWYAVNGSTYTTILGATNPSYTPPVFNLTGTYAYSVAITQSVAGCASGFSPLANVTVVADPNVSSPSAANYCQGAVPSNPLSVTATAGISSAYTYQWYSNGSNNNTSGLAITGATAAAFTPQTSAIGTLYYYCQVNQGAGCAMNSAPAAVTVVPGPAFTSQPLASQTVCTGASLNALNVAYSGATGTPTYQWYSSTTNTNLNGTPISGATNASYTPGANAVGQAYYYCVISFTAMTSCSSISSNPGQVSVIANPVFSVAPLSNQTICQGANPQVLGFTTSGGAGTASYQWYNVNGSNYTPIIGANGLTYTPSASLPVGTYNYAVAMTQNASGCSTGFSSNAQLVVLPQPVVSTPIGGVYCQGGNITTPLSVSVTGGNGSSAYQWYQSTVNTNSGGTAIAGATGNSFTPSLVNFGTLYYYCAVTQNAGCAANSAVATLVSNPSPVISTQPTASQTICVGSAPTPLSTAYTGGVGTPSYQWYVNNQSTTLGGTAIVGANASTYLPSNQVGLGTNYYYCVVTLSNSTCPQATTNIATVNTVANPTLNGPTSATYCQSTSVAQALSVSASGGNGTSYSYQWYSNVNNTNFGGNPILGANNPNYTPNINGSSSNYYCVVTQPGGCQTASAVASIAIVPTPGITSQPIAGQTLCIGGLAQALSISITGGVSNPSFQWYSNTANTMTNATLIANASTPTYTPNAAISTGTTFYFCQVNFTTNSACPALVSNAATIIAVSDPAVSNPANANYCQNATSVAPLSVTASGGINTSYLYQWYSNTNNSNVGGSPIAGANASTYVPLVNQIGTLYYYCEVTQGSGCAVLSGVSAIVIGVAANINLQPTSSQNLCLGQATSPLTVGVSAGNYALNYQWYSNVNNNNFGGSVIVGATNAFYTPPSNALGTKYYYCVITIAGGGCGNLTSNTAGITVLSAPTMFQPNSQTVCCQSSTTPINFVGNATSYSWTANSSSPQLTGFSTSGGGNIPSLLLTNNSATPQNIVYLVTPSNQGCAGTPVQFNISVMPCLSVNVPADQYYCAGETVSSNVFTGVGQTYSWVNTNTTIGLQNAGINFVPNFVAQNTTATTQIATIIVTPSFMGCAGTAQSYSISVYPLPTVDAGVDQEICSGGSVTLTANGAPNLVWDNGILNGQTFVPNTSTTYTVTGTDANGCQNQDDVFVQVNQPTSATLNINACNSYSLNGQTYTQSGTYDQLLSNSAGCDSSLTLNLSLNFSPSQPTVYVQNQINLSTDLTPGLTYQWITCSDLTPISGQTAITYNPSSNGVYAVVVTNGCGSDTSLCTSITTIGLDEHLSSQILLYPNPNNGVFTLEMPQVLIGQTIQIFDMAGRLIEETTAEEMKQHIELNEVATGSYWLRIGSEIPMKLIKH